MAEALKRKGPSPSVDVVTVYALGAASEPSKRLYSDKLSHQLRKVRRLEKKYTAQILLLYRKGYILFLLFHLPNRTKLKGSQTTLVPRVMNLQ